MSNVSLDSSRQQHTGRRWVLAFLAIFLGAGGIYVSGYVGIFSLADWAMSRFEGQAPDIAAVATRAVLGIFYAALLFLGSRRVWTLRDRTAAALWDVLTLAIISAVNFLVAAYAATMAFGSFTSDSTLFYWLASVGALAYGAGCGVAAAWAIRRR